jgi:hypothetical protein
MSVNVPPNLLESIEKGENADANLLELYRVLNKQKPNAKNVEESRNIE